VHSTLLQHTASTLYTVSLVLSSHSFGTMLQPFMPCSHARTHTHKHTNARTHTSIQACTTHTRLPPPPPHTQTHTHTHTCRYQSNDSAFSAMPGSWRWQKRFFIFSDAQRSLYYFKSAEDVQKGGTARGLVRACVMSVWVCAVCMSVCMCVCMCVCVPEYVRLCVPVCVYTCVCVHVLLQT
jgi:hypothetical protein